jgi:hypothetical protein
MGQIESQLTDRIDNLQNEMNHKLELKDLQIKHFMKMNELKCKFNILEAKEKLAPYNDNFCTRRENSKQDHPQPNQQYAHLHRHKYLHMSPSRTQLYHHLCISNVLINTRKSSIQTRDKHKYYTPYNNIRHPANPYRTTIVPTVVPVKVQHSVG